VSVNAASAAPTSADGGTPVAGAPTVPGVTVVAELGRGAHSVVYRVRRDGADLAMKVFVGPLSEDRRTLATFHREAALLALAGHPGLAGVHHVGEAQGRPYLIMDLIEGRELVQELAAGHLSDDRVIALAVETADALAAIHRVGLVHRDVKPQNIILGPTGRARLIDLGMATRSTVDVTDVSAGTLAYAAPEQAGTLKRPVDARSDLYSLGVVLFECVTGHPPFRSPDVGELLRMHAATPPPDLRALRPDLSPALAAIIARLLQKDPDDRYASCAGLIADLRRAATDPGTVFPLAQREQRATGRADVEFVGREPELTDLVALWQRVLTGQGGVALLRGGSGTGKSRLAAEFAARLARTGVPVLTGACLEAAVPFGPLAGAVERYLTGAEGQPEVAGWVRDAAGAAAPYLRRLTPALERTLAGPGTGGLTGDQDDAFVRMVAGFVADLARAAGGAVLVVDDAQWLDGATARVLRHLVPHLAGAPLLLLIAADDTRPEPPHGDGPGPLGFLPAGAADLEITLERLSHDALVRLVRALAGRLTLDEPLLERIIARSGGTPLGVIAYLDAVMDAGLIMPRWGTWVLDVDGLDHVDLPTDMLGLLLRRIDQLGAPSRQLLTAAATLGVRFAPSPAAAVAGLDPDEAAPLLDEAAAHGVLDRHDGVPAFVNDRVRRALLDSAPPGHLRDLHQRAAEVLDDGTATGAAHAYAVARHYLQGHPDGDPRRVAVACLAAGRHALDDHAATEAVEFLRAAVAYAGTQPPAAHAELYEALGTAYHAAGRLTSAADALREALRTAPARLDRARILGQLAYLYRASWDLDASLDAVRQGLAELGAPLPRNRWLLALSAVAMYVAGALIDRTGVGRGTTDPAKLARYRLLADMHAAASQVAVRRLHPAKAVVMDLRARFLAARLGPSLQQVRTVTNLAVLITFLTGRPNRRGFARAARAAARLGDPMGVAYAECIRRIVKIQGGRIDPDESIRWLAQNGPLLDAGVHVDYLHSLCHRLLMAGHAQQALTAYQHGHNRLVDDDMANHAFGRTELTVAAAAGRFTGAEADLRLLDEDIPAFRNASGRTGLLTACAGLAVEQREFGAAFDRIAAEFEELHVDTRFLLPTLRLIYVYLAYGRLEQCARATGPDREPALRAAAEAVAKLRGAAFRGGPGWLLTAHAAVTEAHLRHLQGDAAAALDRVAAADPVLRRADAPLAAYEAARVRARALAELGRTGDAAAQAAGALALAEHHGWAHRAEWIRAEFGASTTPRAGAGVSTTTGIPGTEGRRLAALERLSATASRILNPDELTRVALDETIGMLAAERAYLFLTDGGTGRLVPHLGRDAGGHDLGVLADYGSTIVERVRHSGEPVVVTGTDEGAALGSRSIVAHGLRSIMAAPLQFDGRLLGVVYLDSRVAKGMFTAADVGILTAITNHIAAALETARAAQLAVAVESAHRQRDVADNLREAMVALSASLDPADVLRRLHETLTRLLPSDSSSLIHLAGDKLAVTSGADPSAEPRPMSGDGLDRLLASTAPVTGSGATAPDDAGVFGDRSPDHSWLAVPLHSRDEVVGAVVLTARRPGAYGPTEVQVAAALAGGGMVAYDNARLFAQVQQLATTDGLTGVDNRRHFMALAEQDLARAHDRPDPITAVLLDIDHFKQVNDRYGHQVGDQVIQAVADRVRRTLRGTDRFARYGGEEFVVLLHDHAPQPADIGERLRRAVADTPVDTDAGPIAVTVSVGVCAFHPGRAGLPEALGRADAALYRSKQAGRDRVTVDGPEPVAPDRP
jgi:diguanylate cyclase (GGDEF)-like protein